MEDLDVQIKNLHELTLQLLKQYKHLQKENESLKNINEELENSLLKKDELIFCEQQKNTAENLASLYDSNEKVYLQQKIDAYLKDIENCLSLLNG